MRDPSEERGNLKLVFLSKSKKEKQAQLVRIYEVSSQFF